MVINFVPTDEELEIVARIYEHAGCKRPGLISGDAIVDIFSESVDLSPVVLSNIWNIADQDKSGNLSERGLAIAVRLIGWAQKGEDVKVQLVNDPGPLPTFKGRLQPPIQYNEPNCPRPEWPPLTKSSREIFDTLFRESGPVGELLAGDKVRDIFLQSNLSPEDLWKIWNFADTQQRGALDIDDFSLGMYLIQVMLAGTFKSLPPSIPTHVYRAVFVSRSQPQRQQDEKPVLRTRPPSNGSAGRKNKNLQPAATARGEEAVSPSTTSYIPPVAPTTSLTRPNVKLRSKSSGSILRDIGEWMITPAEKEQSNREFENLDTHKVGYLEGDGLAKYMLTFKLPPEDLALIWDLADLNHDNRLTQDGFAIAMYLIQKKLSGAPLPSTLPISLLPLQYRPKEAKQPESPLQPRAPQSPASPQIPTSPKPPIIRRASSASKSPSASSPPSPTTGRRPPPLPPKPISPMVNVQRRRTMSSAPGSVLRQSGYFEPSEEVSPSPATVPLEQYEKIERENAQLKLKADDLTAELSNKRDLQTRNTALTEEVEHLIAKIHEMEQTSGHLLRMNEQQRQTLEEMTEQIQQLTRQTADEDQIRENLAVAERRLEASMQEKRDLGARLYEARESAEQAASQSREEVENLKRRIETLEEEKEEVQDRARRLERVISGSEQSGSSSTTSLQEMQILMGDVTRENEQLKTKLRTMQRSTAQMFLTSSSGQVEIDELRRSNSSLKAQLEEMETLMRQLQHSSDENELFRVMKDVTHENDNLKARMREMREELAEADRRRETALEASNSQVETLRREAQELREEVAELRLRLQSRGSRSAGHEDEALPPPAYEELSVGAAST